MNIIIRGKTPEYLYMAIDQYVKTYGEKQTVKHFNMTCREFSQLYQQMDVGGPYADIDEMYAAYSTEPGCSKNTIPKNKYITCILMLLAYKKKIIDFK
jgi:hypothetical protein